MQHDTVQAKQTTGRFLLIACALALTGALTASLAQPVHANGQIVVPPVPPANLVVPPGNKVFLMGFASGTQNYICLPSATASSGFAWTFFGPQATLFDDDMKQIITHFLSPNPDENGTPRATWQHSRDTSAVGQCLSSPPPTRTLSCQVRFPGSYCRWWAQSRGLPVVTS